VVLLINGIYLVNKRNFMFLNKVRLKP